MKQLITLLILFCSYVICGQTTDTLKQKKHHVGFSLSPDYCFRKVKSNAENNWIKEAFDTLEVGKLGYTIGITYQYSLNKKIGFVSGIMLSNKGEKTRKQYTSSPTPFNYNSQYYYIDIPLLFKYNFLCKKIKLFASAGFSCNVFLVHKTSQITGYKNDDVKINSYSKTGLSPINFAIIGSVGLECPLTNKWSFRLEPTYRRSVSSISKAPIKKYLYSVGLNFGFFTSF